MAIRDISEDGGDGGVKNFGDHTLATAMANLLWQHEHKTLLMHNAKATAEQVEEIIQQHPRLLMLRSFARRMGRYGRASVIGYAAYVMERQNEALALEFLASFESGIDQYSGQPFRALRARMERLRNRKASQSEQLRVLLGGWERFLARSDGELETSAPLHHAARKY